MRSLSPQKLDLDRVRSFPCGESLLMGSNKQPSKRRQLLQQIDDALERIESERLGAESSRKPEHGRRTATRREGEATRRR
jgi:hypothetical protein